MICEKCGRNLPGNYCPVCDIDNGISGKVSVVDSVESGMKDSGEAAVGGFVYFLMFMCFLFGVVSPVAAVVAAALLPSGYVFVLLASGVAGFVFWCSIGQVLKLQASVLRNQVARSHSHDQSPAN